MKLINKILLLLLLLSSAVIAQQRTTAVGVGLIKHFEGLRTKAYLDPVGIWTVGYGSTGSDVFPNQVITVYQAEQLLIKDLGRFEKYIGTTIIRVLRWHEFDALVSFTFNVGYRLKNELKFAVNTGNTTVTTMKLKQYNKAKVNGIYVVLPGLAKRRNAEAHLYSNANVKLFGNFL